jgi:predicted dinucleotide-binding enzyme
MRIGVLGSGQVGRALGRGWARHGHDIVLGTGDPQRADLREWASETGQRVEGFASAAGHGDLVALALLGTATLGVLEQVGPGAFTGKVVIDATNPLTFDNGRPGLYVGHTDSLGEQVQRALPDARVVKAYNTVGNALMVDPELPDGPPTMFLAGDDEQAKQIVVDLLATTGWDSADLGGISAARELEAMCLAWVEYGARTGTWNHAFRLLRAES